MRRSLAAVIAVLSLAFTLAPVAVNAADPDPSPSAQAPASGPSVGRVDQDPKAKAVADLDRAKAMFGGQFAQRRTNSTRPAPAVNATAILNDLRSSLRFLDADQRREADAILARPTDGLNDPLGNGYSVPSVKKCAGHFCVHWVQSTVDAPPSDEWALSMLTLMNQVWKKEIGKMGYRKPISDGRRGGNGKFDVYLTQLGDVGVYGFCAYEKATRRYQWLASGYCALDNDFAAIEFGGADPMASAQVTAAHEFFHSIQYAYDYREDLWMMESTATWMEERIFDNVDDNRQYLPSGQLGTPTLPLDLFNTQGSGQYGNWAFFEYLTKKYGKGIVKKVWNRAGAFRGAPDDYSIQALSKVLRKKGGLAKVYSEFVGANLIPSKVYPEGDLWTPTPLWFADTLSTAHRGTGKKAIKLLHLTSASTYVASSATLRNKRWMLNILVKGPKPKANPRVNIMIVKRGGKIDKKVVKFNRRGKAQIKVKFSRQKVRGVYISLVNASTRYKCGRRYYFACSGLPIDDTARLTGKRFVLQAKAFKKKRRR